MKDRRTLQNLRTFLTRIALVMVPGERTPNGAMVLHSRQPAMENNLSIKGLASQFP
jgi:hypothetical protein